MVSPAVYPLPAFEIVTDPMQFKATRESGDGDSRVYWGKNFLTVNVDNGDQPVNIDIRPGKYNATQLAAEVERAINEAYGDDSKIQIVQNVDDTLNINLFKLNQDGSSTGLTTPIEVDLLAASFVSDVENITLSVASTAYRFKASLILACVCARNCSLVKSGDAPDKVMFSTSETKLAARRSTSMGVVKPVDEPSWFNLNRLMFKVSSTF